MSILALFCIVNLVVLVLGGILIHRSAVGRFRPQPQPQPQLPPQPAAPPPIRELPLHALGKSWAGGRVQQQLSALQALDSDAARREQEVKHMQLPLPPPLTPGASVRERIENIQKYATDLATPDKLDLALTAGVQGVQDVIDVLTPAAILTVGSEVLGAVRDHSTEIVSAVIAGKLDGSGLDKVIQSVFDKASHTFHEAISPAAVADINLPIATAAIATWREYQLWSSGKTTGGRAVTRIVIDTTSIGLGTAGGGKVGFLIGTAVAGPFGGVFGGLLGAAGGSLFGRGISSKIKMHELTGYIEAYLKEQAESAAWLEQASRQTIAQLSQKSAGLELQFRQGLGCAPRSAIQCGTTADLHQSLLALTAELRRTLDRELANQPATAAENRQRIEQALRRLPSDDLLRRDPLGSLLRVLDVALPDPEIAADALQQVEGTLRTIFEAGRVELMRWHEQALQRHSATCRALQQLAHSEANQLTDGCLARIETLQKLAAEVSKERMSLGMA